MFSDDQFNEDHDDDEPEIREDDHIGQATGIPSPGYGPDEIARPMSGWKECKWLVSAGIDTSKKPLHARPEQTIVLDARPATALDTRTPGAAGAVKRYVVSTESNPGAPPDPSGERKE